MKHKLLISILAGLLGFGIPSVLEARLPLTLSSPSQSQSAAPSTQPTQETVPEATDQALLPPTDGCILMDVLLPDGFVTQLPLNEYLVGVLLAEMPASFPIQAQMAQAVVARTYALRQWAYGGKHENAAVCTDPACCQAWISYEEYSGKNGEEAARSAADSAALAVVGTDGQALFYEGRLIEATYFSCSGGRTEAAVAVWGSDVPYLQSVDSPGEEDALHYTETVVFPSDQLALLLRAAKPEIVLSGSPEDWFGIPSYTEGGGVDVLPIGGVPFTGTELRSLLSLRSTAFTVAVSGDSVAITTLGNGHRVGMSQYGARAMAEAGSSYEEILAHYYQGAQLRSYTPDS